MVVNKNSLAYLYFNYKQHTITLIIQTVVFNIVLSLLLLNHLLNPINNIMELKIIKPLYY